MLVLMVCFFGTIITVNFTMAFLASKSWAGLVVKNSYVASQQYNKHLEAANLQKATGLVSEVTYRDNQLAITVRDNSGMPAVLTDGKIKIGRPVYEQADKVLHFVSSPAEPNPVSIHLEPGVWAMEISGLVSGTPYRRDVRIHVNSDNTGFVK